MLALNLAPEGCHEQTLWSLVACCIAADSSEQYGTKKQPRQAKQSKQQPGKQQAAQEIGAPQENEQHDEQQSRTNQDISKELQSPAAVEQQQDGAASVHSNLLHACCIQVTFASP
jgi:hypothetical protein